MPREFPICFSASGAKSVGSREKAKLSKEQCDLYGEDLMHFIPFISPNVELRVKFVEQRAEHLARQLSLLTLALTSARRDNPWLSCVS